jgi:hypothetical protein
VQIWDCTTFLLRKFRERALFCPPCEGGYGGGPVGLKCTKAAGLAQSIDEADRTCAASPPWIACRFRPPLPANGECTDGKYSHDARACSRPPNSPFTSAILPP